MKRAMPAVPTRRAQRGTALLSVLLLAAMMTVLAVAMLDDIRFGLRRAANAQDGAQARRYALGAESLARQRITRLRAEHAQASQWNGVPLVFPIGHGLVQARLSDASACFNLNSVVQGAPEQWWRRDTGVRQFVALLQALGFSAAQAQALADTLVDWIDSDGERSPLGAEDATYATGSAPYLSSATLLAEPSELRAVRGYDARTYARLRPFVCALPSTELSPVNLNALRAEQAPLLSMLSLGAIPPAEGRRLITARPRGGWDSADAFWSQPQLAETTAALPEDIRAQATVQSRWFALDTRVEHAGAQVVLGSLLHADGSGPPRVLARRWGGEE